MSDTKRRRSSDAEPGPAADTRAVPRAVARSKRASELSAPIRQKGVITIPQPLRQQLNLEEGDQVIFSVRNGSIVITPAAVVPRDQAWFWTPEWQAKEAEADAEVVAGGGTVYETEEDFLSALKNA